MYLFIYLASLSLSYPAMAVRSLRIPTIDTPTGWTSGGGACWAGFIRRFDIINLSNTVDQDVTIITKNISLQFGSCDGASLLTGNWVYAPNVPDCAGANASDASAIRTDKIKVLKGSSYEYGVSYACHILRSGTSSCAFNPVIPSTGFSVDLNGSIIHRAAAEHKIIVDQDQGAILVNIMSYPYSHCKEFGESTKFNIQVNGGRPF